MHGELSTLDVALDLHQYQIIKDLLMYNLGENTEQILPSVSTIVSSLNTVSIFLSLKILSGGIWQILSNYCQIQTSANIKTPSG